MSGKPWTRKEEERAAKMRRCGCPTWIIALRLSRTTSSVMQRLIEIGVRLKRSPGKETILIRRLIKEGWHDWEIALKLGCSISNAAQMRRRAGIPASHKRNSENRQKGWKRIKEKSCSQSTS